MANNETFTKEEMENLQFTERLDKMKRYAKAMDDVLQLSDLANATTKTWTVFSKDSLRTYLQNPYSTNSQTNLRNLSRFLKTLSFPLRRLINYLASLPDLSVYKVIPNISMVEEPDEESLLQDYEEVCRYVRSMDLELDLFKMLVIAWGEDVAYFFPVENEDGTTLLYPLDGQYCKISGVGYNGLYRMAYDFSFFQGSNSFYLDIWPKEFKQKYNKYQSDSSLRWQQLDEGRAFKINIENPELVVSPLVSLFEQIIDLIDLQSLTSVRDALEVYKLLVMKIPLLQSKNPDDFALNLELAKKFYNKALDILPEEIGLILSPGMDVDSISFDKNATSDTNAIADSYQRLIAPSIEREIRNSLTDNASEQAIKMFEVNLKPLLMQAPLKGKRILGFDPGYRMGCKLAVIDENGTVLDTNVIYPTEPFKKIDEAKRIMTMLISKHKVDVISIGNGTASKETENLVAELIKEVDQEVYYMVVSEAGASVYSASPIASPATTMYCVSRLLRG